MQATNGPSTSAVPATVADPALASGPMPADTPMLPAVPLLVPLDLPDTAVSSAMCLWAEDVDIPVDIARQAVLHVHANFASELSQHPSTDCTCLSKPLQELMVTAIRAVTGDALFHLPCGSDARSDSSETDPASDNPVADSLFMPTTATATVAAPRRSGRQHKPATEYWKVPPPAPGGAQ
ncbi:TPA: hypothetical protein ACH3X2_012534 [Trebouxia sp. C0005]